MTINMRKVLVAVVGALLIFVLLLIVFYRKQSAPEMCIQKSDVEQYLQDGDIICRLGDRMWSAVIKDMSQYDKRFSHVGIVRKIDGALTIVNADTDNVNGKDQVLENSLAEFLTVARAIGVYRFSGDTIKPISSVVMKYIGYPFDWDFDMQESSKIYCTELLYLVLQEVAPEVRLQTVYVKELDKEIVPLEAVSNSPYFQEIVYVSGNKDATAKGGRISF